MNIGNAINKFRTEANLTQAQFSEMLGVSQQAVQKWESGASMPDIDKIVMISKCFDVSLDDLILGVDIPRSVEATEKIKPRRYQALGEWESWEEYYLSSACLKTEYEQCYDEGVDIEPYKDVFYSIAKLPKSEIKVKSTDVLFEVVLNAKRREGYKYIEPSALEQIKNLRRKATVSYTYDPDTLNDKIHGAWMGRICGCMLGKTVECCHTNELVPFLKETGNYPMHRYVYRSDLTPEILKKYTFPFEKRVYADEIDGMPSDDDTNYVVIAQKLIKEYGKDFSPQAVAENWMRSQSKYSYCTAERVAYCNLVKGYTPPESAIYKNPFREWIGAQIRGDYFGYINPGNPELAAEMAWRDASISHVKNGIYGEMFVSAMLAVAATTNNIEEIILGGLAEIPHTSRLYEAIMEVIDTFRRDVPQKKCFDIVHSRFDEYTKHGEVHTISNAMIVVASLLYGGGDFAKSICMAVETGYDTDCNGATVGSVLGMANGVSSIPDYWKAPINDTLHTTVFGVGTVKITDRVKMTMQHILTN